jgi:uncharacterized protein YbbC (DUF1343 family)
MWAVAFAQLRKINLILAFLCSGLIASSPYAKSPIVRPGIDVLLTEQIDLVKGKRIGLITNPTGVTSALKSTIDALNENPDLKLVALFAPEHGVRGDIAAGVKVETYVDPRSGIPVYSLYGRNKKPTAEMLKGVDVLIYDIQDIGSRAYTYIYTMARAMQAAKESGIPFIVLDRPNPFGGELVEGPVLSPAFKSSIGMYPIPFVYGLTVGELARFFNTEFAIEADLVVISMKGWQRSMRFDDTGLEWVPTSPHIPHAKTALFCATVGCIGELQSINEGVGYTLPFELIGAPWIDGDLLATELNQRNLPGVYFRSLHYRPFYFASQNQELAGVQIHILDSKVYQPMRTQIHILTALNKLYPQQEIFVIDRSSAFDNAMGTDQVRLGVMQGKSAEDIVATWQGEIKKYLAKRSKYLLY